MPRPWSMTVTELSGWIVTSIGVVAARERLVDGVVDDLVDEVVEAARARRADVHAGAQADRLEALEHGDVLCGVRSLGHNKKALQIAALPGASKCIRTSGRSRPGEGSWRRLERPFRAARRRSIRRGQLGPSTDLVGTRFGDRARRPIGVVVASGLGQRADREAQLDRRVLSDGVAELAKHVGASWPSSNAHETSSSRRGACRPARCAPARRCARSSSDRGGPRFDDPHHPLRWTEAAELARDLVAQASSRRPHLARRDLEQLVGLERQRRRRGRGDERLPAFRQARAPR